MTNRQLFLSHIAQTTQHPLGIEVIKAEGVYLYGPNGEKYMDMISGISVSNLGHCHPKVVKAVQEQSASFMHLMVYGEYIYSPQTMLAKTLKEVLPKELDNFYFTNSGTEATEGAFKLAKRYTQRSEIISCYHSYHGSTAGALSAMGDETYQSAFRPLVPGHSFIEYNNLSDIDKITKHTAAVIIELVSAEKGVIIGDYDYFQKLRTRCTEVGALLILDEIQTGCGRTGTLFAFEQYDIIPDILLLGKGFGGGMPIAAFIANREVMKTLSFDPILGHISTYGGNAVCCAAALASLKVLKEETLLKEVEKKGLYLQQSLEGIGFDLIRRKGLLLAVDMDSQVKNFELIEACITHGIITDWFLFNTQCMRICPPLTITYDQIDEFIDKLSQVLAIQN
ncbi:MAG: aspartate aminotransferase family protein [Chitinophagales bacterium]|nr:aminotransferase class III-fold pyridoxal phosphate-dependent enzyme [Sphingobacteriales bacterium]